MRFLWLKTSFTSVSRKIRARYDQRGVFQNQKISSNLLEIDKLYEEYKNVKFMQTKGFSWLKGGGYQTHNFEHFAHLIIIWGRDEKHSNDVFSTVFVDKKLGKPTLKVSENVQNYYFFLM